MKRLESWDALLQATCPRIVYSIGNFDGLHLGHRAVLDAARDLAAQSNACLCVLTFTSNTRHVLFPDSPVLQLMSAREREAGVAGYGADYFAEIPFTEAIARLEPEDFLEQLIQDRAWAAVVVGDDFAFGRHRHGNVATLASFFSAKSGTALIIPQHEVEGERVSSSLIREQLLGGRVEAAARLLGRHYSVSGVREKGDAIGRQIGYPTINIGGVETMLPADGVYAARCALDDGVGAASMAYVGTRPTLEGQRRVVEAHILHDAVDVPCGAWVRLNFLGHLRGDRKFSGLAALTRQLGQDAVAADAFFGQQ